jgi:ribonucleoside-triphosphate reductase
VYYPISAFDKIDIEAPYHALCNAGHITYIELDGDPSDNLEAFEAVIRHMKEVGIGYGSVNHPVDRDPACGFSGIITGSVCPSCGREEHSGQYGFERLRRITGYLVGSLERWNDGKKAEEAARVKHNVTGVYSKDEKSAREAAKKTQEKALGKA